MFLVVALFSLGPRAGSAVVHNNLVEDNGRVGIFFHRSTDEAQAYDNTCRRNAEGDVGVFESTGVKIHDNIMEVRHPREVRHPLPVGIFHRCGRGGYIILQVLRAETIILFSSSIVYSLGLVLATISRTHTKKKL